MSETLTANDRLSGEALQKEIVDLRCKADGMRWQARLIDLSAARLEKRLMRLGLRSWYHPPTDGPDGRPHFRLGEP